MMKKTFLYMLAVVAAALCFTSCQQEEPNFDESLLIGKWNQVNTQVYFIYASDYTGKTWDEAEDVSEAEANTFRWTLDRATLTQIHIIPVVGGEAPEVYTVTQLTSSKLTYEDDFGHEYSFNKVN